MGPDPAEAPPANGCWGSGAPTPCSAARSHRAGTRPQRHLQVGRGLAVAVLLPPCFHPSVSWEQACSQTWMFGENNGQHFAPPETRNCLRFQYLIRCCSWTSTKPPMLRQKLVLFTAPGLGGSLCDCQGTSLIRKTH